LLHQHPAADGERRLRLTDPPLPPSDRATLAGGLRRFDHMYWPHTARENTVLFPAPQHLVGAKAYNELGEHGFEHAVDEVGKLEPAIGVDDLAKLTA